MPQRFVTCNSAVADREAEMEDRNLEKALEIVSALISGEEIGRTVKKNVSLYETYESSSEVYELVHKVLKSFNLSLYEYKENLYITAGEKNRVFGYSNEELKKTLGIKLNRELYLCYFIIYNIMIKFYHDTSGDTLAEYIKIDETIHMVDDALVGVVRKLESSPFEEAEEESFRSLAVLWEDLPIMSGEESSMRAARNSKAGYVKLVFNFLVSQDLFIESNERYYPKDRMRALMENYFEEYQGRLHELIKMGEQEDATY